MELLTRQEAAHYLRLSPQTLANMAVRREGPPYLKVTRKTLYRREDLDAWLRAVQGQG